MDYKLLCGVLCLDNRVHPTGGIHNPKGEIHERQEHAG